MDARGNKIKLVVVAVKTSIPQQVGLQRACSAGARAGPVLFLVAASGYEVTRCAVL